MVSKRTIREIKLPFLLEGPYVMASVATKIFQELVEGVFYIHNMGIVHRDLKVSGEAVKSSSSREVSGKMWHWLIELDEIMYLRGLSLFLCKSLSHRPGTLD